MPATLVTVPAIIAQSTKLSNAPTATAVEVTLDSAVAEAVSLYVSRCPISQGLHQKAVKHLPGGNTRAVLHNNPFPICMTKGEGNRLWDHDGNKYFDFVGELTAGLYGHSNPIIRSSIISTLENVGVNLGATTVEEDTLAELICDRFPAIEQLRFCNSGTEANLYALGIARHTTGKRKVVVFDGGYHGGVLTFGHGIAPANVDRADWIVGVYNDVEGVQKLLQSSSDIAAVIVEGMQGAGGCIPATMEFLLAIQTTAAKNGILFIMDEVMTSRLHPHGLHGKYGLRPDLVTLGKYIGGGLAIGVFGGRQSLLSVCDPRDPRSISHSGTFNNNTLAMAAGYTGLSQIYTPEVNLELNALGDYFRTRLQSVSQGTKLVVTGVGAVLTIHFQSKGTAPSTSSDFSETVQGLKTLFWLYCVNDGYWITERGMLSLILGTTKAELDAYIKTVQSFISTYRHLVLL